MGISFKSAVLILGLACIVHAGLSAAQHKSFVRITEQEYNTLPLDILIQTLLGLFVSSCGIFMVSGEFKDIQVNAELKSKSFDTLTNPFTFCSFHHRGKTLYTQ